MLNFIGYVFYGIAIADFLGMFFGYDFTGQFWTPYLFGAIGAGCQSLGKNQVEVFTKKVSYYQKELI